MIEFRNPHYIVPPGSLSQYLSLPYLEKGSMELAIFQEHRYAFFYWLKWRRNFSDINPPCLVSLDWHQDLCFPCDTEKEWLSKLNQKDDGEVAIFAWSKLAGNNDGHILSAAYLNLIGNIYVCCQQGSFDSDWEDEELIDLYGNPHMIKKFKATIDLEKYLLSSDENQVYFDIDLDFFTLDNPFNGVGEKFTYKTKEEIINLLTITTPLMNWIMKRLKGFTIATEPKHCGGLLKSNSLLDIINEVYFKPDLLTNNSDWRHKNGYY